MAVKRDPKTGLWYFRTRVKPPWLPPEHPGFRTKQTPPAQINSKKTAEEWERNWVRDVTRDPKSEAGPKASGAATVREAAVRYLHRLKADPDKSTSYIVSMETNLFYHVLPKFGDRLLSSITDDELEEFKLELQNKTCRVNGFLAKKKRKEGTAHEDQKEAVGRKKLAPNTVRTILRTFQATFKLAKQKCLVDHLPVFPKPPKAAKKKPVFLTFEEAASLHAALADDPDDQLTVLFAIKTGLRAGEQIALRWEDLELDAEGHEQVVVRRAFKRDKDQPNKVDKPKGRDDTAVPLPPALVRALQDARGRRFGSKKAKGLVFVRKDEPKMMTHDLLTTILERGRRRAQIDKHVRWHDLRHTFGSHHVMKGTPLAQVREWMGHKDISTTQIYTHLSTESGRELMIEAEVKIMREAEAKKASLLERNRAEKLAAGQETN